MSETAYSLSDIAAITGDRRYNGFDDNMWIIVLFFLMFGWGGNGGWGNNGLQGALTRGEMFDGFNNQDTQRKLDGIAQGLCDGFYANNTTMLQGFAGLGQEIANSRFAAQNCCCETNRNIDSVRYEASKNTCDIIRAIEKDGDATRALINSNTMQNLRDKLAERDRDLQTANFQLSQQAQSANLIGTLRPFPQPAYITCSPYQSANSGYGCGYGCGY